VVTEVRAAVRVAAALCVATAALLLPAPPVTAGEQCVGVVVDARLLGGDVRTGCAKGDPATGLEALADAGFRYAFAPRQPGLVCQVDGVPECADTSTTTYWSYWYRPKGSGSWVYSAKGAGSHDPAPGSTEAWVWQDGGRRSPPDIPLRDICPQVADSGTTAPPAPTPRKTKTSRADSTATAAAPASPRTSARTTTKAARPARPSATATGTAASTTAGSTAPVPPTPSNSVTAPRTTAAASAAPSGGDGPPWLELAVGAGLVAALAAAAVLRSRRNGQ
jgi:hypothetical protein